jgi:Family of unknown function (DUF5808)
MADQQQPQQSFLGIPMNWEWNVPKMLHNYWNADDDRIFLPKVFGIGWDVNGHALLRRIGLMPEGPNKER